MNVCNEREANNACERRDFEDDEVKSHIRLSSAQPFNWNPGMRSLLCFKGCENLSKKLITQ